MKVVYTGRQVEVSSGIRSEVEEELNKIHRILGPRLELEAHFIFTRDHHGSFTAEVTLHARQHSLVAMASSHKQLTAVQDVLEKLEKQAVRNRNRWREIRRQPKTVVQAKALAAAAAAAKAEALPEHLPPGRENTLARAAGAAL